MRIVDAPLDRHTIKATTRLIVDRFELEQVDLSGNCASGETTARKAVTIT